MLLQLQLADNVLSFINIIYPLWYCDSLNIYFIIYLACSGHEPGVGYEVYSLIQWRDGETKSKQINNVKVHNINNKPYHDKTQLNE